MCSVAILLWICCVSAAASAHEYPLYVDEVYLPQVRKRSGSWVHVWDKETTATFPEVEGR
jgi:hypothetical protein